MFVLVRQFADGSCFADPVHTDDHHDVWFRRQRCIEIRHLFYVVLLQQGCDLIDQQLVQFRGVDIFVALDAILHALDDTERRLHAHIGGDERFLKVIPVLIL